MEYEAQPVRTLNALTIDVEDYFHTEAMASVVGRNEWDRMPSRVCGNVWRLFEILAAHNVRATFFFLGWLAERFPALVGDAVRLGHEVGCHSYWHKPVFSMTANEFRMDTLRAKKTIEDAAGVEVRGYRAPSFSIVRGAEWAYDVLAEAGFAYDSSVHPIRHDLYSNPNASRYPYRIQGAGILEFPIATARIAGNNLPIGGGGFLRLLPYAWVRWGVGRFNQVDCGSAVMYLHPWEIDPMQPRLASGFRSRVRQYLGLRTLENKLHHLLRDFHFAPIASVFRKVLSEPANANTDGGFATVELQAHLPGRLEKQG